MVDVEPEIIQISKEGEKGFEYVSGCWDLVKGLDGRRVESVVEKGLEVGVESGLLLWTGNCCICGFRRV